MCFETNWRNFSRQIDPYLDRIARVGQFVKLGIARVGQFVKPRIAQRVFGGRENLAIRPN